MTLRDLGYPVGTTRMVRAGQLDRSPECAYSLSDHVALGGDDHLVKCRAGRRGLINPLDERPARQICQRLAWKPSSPLAGWDDSKDLRGRQHDGEEPSATEVRECRALGRPGA